jgi:hypothetical protein
MAAMAAVFLRLTPLGQSCLWRYLLENRFNATLNGGKTNKNWFPRHNLEESIHA